MASLVNPDSTSTYTSYYPTGEVRRQWGARTYPVGYGYDYAGRKTKMTNWSNFAAQTGTRVTTWNYDSQRGWLNSKVYADGNGPAYQYTPAGRLDVRTWARGTNTIYTYDAAGGLQTVTYNDSVTPHVGYGYDRRGRQTNITQTFPDTTTAVTSLTYSDVGQALSEAYTGGPLNGISVTNGYDGLLRRTNLVSRTASTVLTSNLYTYDAISRLLTVSDGTNSATYGYLTNSPLVSNIVFKQSVTTRMTTTKQYDYLNRLTSISSANGSTVLDSHGYAYNNANQRTVATNTDGSYWVYGYDALGQVTSGKKYWSDATTVAGQQYGYGFDDIGNRTSTQTGGDQWGNNLRSASYSANNLNQYTSRTVPAAVDIIGAATNAATVTVNNQPTYRKGNYYRAQVPVNNASAPVWQPMTNLAVLNESTNFTVETNIVGNIFVPQTPEAFGYDLDGNLTNDGRWIYTWDGENRLISMTNIANVPVAARMELDFVYDSKGRRIGKSVNTNGVIATQLFAYDEWSLLTLLSSPSIVSKTFTWGMDFNGSTRADDGIGGLLFENSSRGDSFFMAYDANGDITAVISSVTGAVEQREESDIFGNQVRTAMLNEQINPISFSTKFLDCETGLIYFGYRYLDARNGRWLSKDPLLSLSSHTDENLDEQENETWETVRRLETAFVDNDPVSKHDVLGLWPTSSPFYGRVLNYGFAIPRTHYFSTIRVLPLSMIDFVVVDAASVYVDDSQGTSDSYKHAMRAPGESKGAARSKANNWVRQNLLAARAEFCRCGSMDEAAAAWHFGLALHTVQDSTSPSHHNFQTWHGLSPFWLGQAVAHIEKEAFDPGPRSNLDKATFWMYGFLNCSKPLPLPVDFFPFNADHSWIH